MARGQAADRALAKQVPQGTAWGKLSDYYELTKPRIVMLMLITAYATLWVAAGSAPSLGLSLLTLLGTALAAGSANALNCYIDRDIDAIMRRTRNRPLPAGSTSPPRPSPESTLPSLPFKPDVQRIKRTGLPKSSSSIQLFT